MSLSGPLRENLNRYHKHKYVSVDGTVPGIDYNHYHRPYNRPPVFPSPISRIPPAEMYDPDPGLPEFPESEYQPYEWEMSHPVAPLRRELATHRPMQTIQPDIPLDEPASPEFRTSFESEKQFVQGLLELMSPERHLDTIPDEQELGMEGLMHGQGFREGLMADLSQDDPTQEAEAAFGQPSQFDQLEPVLPGPTTPDIAQDAGGLESVVEQEMNSMAAASEIEDAITHQVEPWPAPSPYVLYDDYLQMYEQQLQQLLAPFAIPGMSPMGPGPMM